MSEPNNKATLYRKLATIAGEIETVEKDGRNKDQGYTYATPASVFRALKPLMAKYQIAIVPMQAGRQDIDTGRTSRGGNPYMLSAVDMTYLILDGESGESITATWSGVAGTYGDDKGNAKAQTIALRTFLIQLFQIPAEDADVDPDSGGQAPISRQQPQQRQQEPRTTSNGNGGKASEKQIKMLFAIWKNSGFDGSLKDWIAEEYKCGVDELSIKQASEAIETLQKPAA